jgi:hypothetical protein
MGMARSQLRRPGKQTAATIGRTSMTKTYIPFLAYRLFSALFLLAITAPTAHADDTPAGPPSTPILRIETGMHTAAIQAISVDAANRYLVTGSYDKTVRVWDAKTGEPLQVLRPPIDSSSDGQIYAVAISPDGSAIACGGWTGCDWDNTSSVYIFNRATGQIMHRLVGLTTEIGSLAFSPDGQYLACSLLGGGILLYRTSDWSQVGAESKYPDSCYGTAFADVDGKLLLATSCWDGYVRLYSVKDHAGHDTLQLLAKRKIAAGSHHTRSPSRPTAQNWQ